MKLLIATDFSPDALGGGATVVRQMLKGFPSEVHWWSLHGGLSSARGQQVESVRFRLEIASHTHVPPGLVFPQRRLSRTRALLMEIFWSKLAAYSLMKTFRAVRPQHLWFIPHNWSILPIHHFSKMKGCAGIDPRIHVTVQDFPDIHSYAERWGIRVVQKMARMQEEIYRRADSRDATSLPMLAELRSRTGCEGQQMLHAGLEAEDFAYLDQSPKAHPSSQPVRIAYAGTILVEEDFGIMVKRLQEIRRRLPNGLILDIWSAHSYRDRHWFDPVWIREHGHADEKDLQENLRGCDWGFSLMALEERDIRYNRFSFPTKFITYLGAGLPILGLGHPQSSLMRLMDTYRVGYSAQNIQDLEKSNLLEVLANPAAKTLYRSEMQRCARECFDAARMRARLWSSLTGQGS